MPVGKPLTVVQLASTLMNVILLVMMPSAITPPVKTFLARTNALALLATLVLHVLITTNVLMTLTTAMLIQPVPILMEVSRAVVMKALKWRLLYQHR